MIILSNPELQTFRNVTALDDLVLLGRKLVIELVGIIHSLEGVGGITLALDLFSSLLGLCIKSCDIIKDPVGLFCGLMIDDSTTRRSNQSLPAARIYHIDRLSLSSYFGHGLILIVTFVPLDLGCLSLGHLMESLLPPSHFFAGVLVDQVEVILVQLLDDLVLLMPALPLSLRLRLFASGLLDLVVRDNEVNQLNTSRSTH